MNTFDSLTNNEDSCGMKIEQLVFRLDVWWKYEWLEYDAWSCW
ncbi:hypothetical protein [Francisella persica]|nr:hypothetical protein [Francisella persica]